MDRISLCVFSQAVGGQYEYGEAVRIEECPLGLTRTEGKKCPCKTRRDVGRIGGDGTGWAASEQHVNVLECLFPLMWDGKEIRNVEAFVAAWRPRRQQNP